jgi:hypothetical protein
MVRRSQRSEKETTMMSKITLAAAALVALGGTALMTAAPASAAPSVVNKPGHLVTARYLELSSAQLHRRLARVSATGDARGALVPYFVKKAKAQREAIRNWSAKVTRIYGPQYSSWSRATGKTTACSRSASVVTCRVSAIPR